MYDRNRINRKTYGSQMAGINLRKICEALIAVCVTPRDFTYLRNNNNNNNKDSENNHASKSNDSNSNDNNKNFSNDNSNKSYD